MLRPITRSSSTCPWATFAIISLNGILGPRRIIENPKISFRPSQVPSRPQQQLPIQKPFYVDSIADEPKVIVLEEQLDAEEGGDVGKQTKKQPFIRNSVEMLQQRASGEQQVRFSKQIIFIYF